MLLNTLNPDSVWKYFEEITRIPRPSGNEEKIQAYVVQFAKDYNLAYKQDETGNILITKDASKGFEKIKSVCLQSHLDMVCEKHASSKHIFETDPIELIVDGDWVKAKDTTLGADNGIGIATQLALLTDKELEHGPIECLFTVDEETGLNGANGIESGFFKSNILLNLDSEDEGEICIGCAGGINTIATLKYKVRKTPENYRTFRIEVSGLQGGHSGTDIHKNRGNSIKILNQLLWETRNRFGTRLSVFEGGNLRNAIPREAYAIVVVPAEYKDVFMQYIHDYTKIIRGEYLMDEPNITISLTPADMPEKVIKKKQQEKLLNALYACPHGVIAWSRVISGLVETSTNLASVKFVEPHQVVINTSQRSAVNSSKLQIANAVKSTFKLANARVENSAEYPGWNPNPQSEILNIAKKSYQRLFNKEPKVNAIHAGLECGLFLEKYPCLDMISFGPTIVDAHSPSERINISSTEKFWKFLKEILINIPEE
jgi:dipeptidase D